MLTCKRNFDVIVYVYIDTEELYTFIMNKFFMMFTSLINFQVT